MFSDKHFTIGIADRHAISRLEFLIKIYCRSQTKKKEFVIYVQFQWWFFIYGYTVNNNDNNNNNNDGDDDDETKSIF